MVRHFAFLATVVVTAACGRENGPTGPTGSSSTPPAAIATSLSVTALPRTVFIGDTFQLEAREVLSDGTTRPAAGVTWQSDNTSVATVSSAGLLTAIKPGETAIVAETAHRGTLRIRVYPNFAGSWRGTEILATCTDTNDLDGLCEEIGGIGEAYLHQSRFTQTDSSLTGVLDAGDNLTAGLSGVVTIDGEAQLGTAPLLPADPDITTEIRNWRTRADQPGQMTGSYEIVLVARGLQGELTFGLRLQHVAKTAGISPARTRSTAIGISRKVREIAGRKRRSSG